MSEPGYPNTFGVPADPRISHPEIFDPALKQHYRAFRRGEPVFDDPRPAERWRGVRRRAMERAAAAVAGSPWGSSLVLRGSLLLKVWLGEPAREPGDLDWVVVPPTVSVGDAAARGMPAGLPALIAAQPAEGFEWLAAQAAWDDIWTYERAPGRRLVLPWRSPGLPPGFVQMDFVFGEELWDHAVRTPMTDGAGGTATPWTATPEQSLAWKIQWLESDQYPQGKDLYDAVLLAEHCRLSPALLERALEAGGRGGDRAAKADFPMDWRVDWEEFRREYPWVVGEAPDWQARLVRALEPTFRTPQLPSAPGGGLTGEEPMLPAAGGR